MHHCRKLLKITTEQDFFQHLNITYLGCSMLDLVSQSSSFDGNGLEFLHEIVSATLILSLLVAFPTVGCGSTRLKEEFLGAGGRGGGRLVIPVGMHISVKKNKNAE